MKKEEIEDLGFVYNGIIEKTLLKEPCVTFSNLNLNLILGWYNESNRISLATRDPSKNEIYLKTNQDPCYIPPLKIKTKTDLKRLIKQLGL